MKLLAVLDLTNEDMSDDGILRQVEEIKEMVSQRAREHINDTNAVLEEKCDIQVQRANGTRKINTHEKCSISALAHYKAHKLNCSALALELAVQDEFKVDQIGDLQAKDVPKVIEFLVDWNGVN